MPDCFGRSLHQSIPGFREPALQRFSVWRLCCFRTYTRSLQAVPACTIVQLHTAREVLSQVPETTVLCLWNRAFGLNHVHVRTRISTRHLENIKSPTHKHSASCKSVKPSTVPQPIGNRLIESGSGSTVSSTCIVKAIRKQLARLD